MQQPTTYHSFWLAAALLALLLLPGCRDYQHPGFEPGVAGARPVEQLDHFLRTDSVIAGLGQLPGTQARLDSLLLWADLMKNYNQDAALEYANEAYRIATERGWRLSQAVSLYYRAMIKEKKQRLGERIEDAIADAKISARLLERMERKDWEVRLNNLLGGLYLKQSKFDSARFFLQQALELTEQADLSEKEKRVLKGEIFHDLGNVAYTEGDSTLNEAQSNYQKSLEVYLQTNNKASAARLRVALGMLYTRKGYYEQAEEEFRQSETYAIDAQDYDNLVDVYRHLGYLRRMQYIKTEQDSFFFEAMSYFNKLLPYQKENLYQTYDLIGQTFQNRAKRTQNFSFLDSAIVYYRMAVEKAGSEGVLAYMDASVNNLSVLCAVREKVLGEDCTKLLGNDGSSMSFLNRNYSHIVGTIETDLAAANERIRKFERKEQMADNQRRVRNTWMMAGGGFVIAILIFLLILQWQKQKRLQARMEALRAQINPHFISNSLNAIENLVNQDQREAAAKYLIHFSRLSRQILNSSRAPIGSLTEEVKMLEHFLALEQLRFRDKLHFQIEVSPNLNPQLIEMPAMILQPYVENAIWHGIKPKPGPGFLRVHIERNGKELVSIIEDDGIGREKSREMQAKSILQKHKSQGMAITEERLKALGKAKGSKVEIIDLYDTTGNPVGTRVIVRLPFRLLKNKE